ncbi:putative phosphoheptose isomerase [Chlorobium limicola DSM 245]|uniref:Putative phosphoheptose isomerase n=1 Tax=Chlorobium limicola (strain DSM 245 / NBRC 103803 / 6330) TaxID=290315 RepID=B3EF64_CHLL2|nr:SIS domain-containing protein [Chlorobium limicola]ACD90926.1 putative phosphoheptose isomerase [Chlorobium limicola DSM 245]
MFYKNYIDALSQSMNDVVFTDIKENEIEQSNGLEILCELSRDVKAKNKTKYLCGNGASASICNHMALDWSKNGSVKTSAFSDSALFTALVNDLGVEEIFSAPLQYYANKGDLLVTISSSGNSVNIINAIKKAREIGMRVITLSGLKMENKSRLLGDINIYVPAKTYGIVESVHAIIMHAWLDKYMGIAEWDRNYYQNMKKDQFQL